MKDEDALRYHSKGRPGKIEVVWTKPVASQLDLSLAYTPGVAAPCREIAADPRQGRSLHGAPEPGRGRHQRHRGARARQHRPAAAKPVMEGKAVLFKRFADIDVFDIEIDENDPRRSSRSCAPSSRRSAASTSRTSGRPTASSSSARCASG